MHARLYSYVAPSIAAAIVLTFALASPVFAQSSSDIEAIKQELRSLREAQESTAKDVEAIKTMLQQAMAPHPAPAGTTAARQPQAPVTLNIAGRPSKGNPHAKVTLVEYSDYECPYCGQFASDVYRQIDRDYVKTNKINYIFKNYPIAQLHPSSIKAHKAAVCAGDQGRFWEMHDKLFADQRGFSVEKFMADAQMLKLDPIAFRACLESTSHEDMIQQDITEARTGGVQGTPVFVLAFTDPNGQAITPARVIVGAQPYSAFTEAIDALLAQAAAPTK